MYNFKIACSGYSEYCCFELTHENQFLKEEFHKIVENAIKNTYENMDENDKSLFDRISYLFSDYIFVCNLHKLGFKYLEYANANELDDLNISEGNYSICGSISYIDARIDDCDFCNNLDCGINDDSLEMIFSEFGAICIGGEGNGY